MPTLSSHIVKREVASVQDVEQALARQAQYGGDLATNLLELARVSEEQLTQAIAETIGLEAAPPGELPATDERVRRLVPREIASRYGFFPLGESEGQLVIAVSEPLPAEVVSDLEFSLGFSLEQRATTLVRVTQAISRDYGVTLDQRIARVLAGMQGKPDPHPSSPVAAEDQGAPLPSPPEAEPVAPERETPASAQATEPQAARDSGDAIGPKLIANFDWGSLARAEHRSKRARKRRGPYTVAMAETDLLDAEARDDVVAAFFDYCSQFFEYSALFAVHGDLAEGRNAQGSGAPRSKVVGIGVPLDLPSTLGQVVVSEQYRLARLSASGLDGALVKDLQRRPGPVVLILPIRVRERAVLVLYGDHGDNDVSLDAIGDVLSFAPLVSSALERWIRKRKERARGELRKPEEAPGVLAPPPRRVELPSREERASALASALESGAVLRSVPPPSGLEQGNDYGYAVVVGAAIGVSSPPAQVSPSASQGLLSAPPIARPVISIGPGPSLANSSPPWPRSEPPGQAFRLSSEPPASLSLRSFPSSHPTPIPSSFAPGAPPHSMVPVVPRAISAPTGISPDEMWEPGVDKLSVLEHSSAEHSPETKRGLGFGASKDDDSSSEASVDSPSELGIGIESDADSPVVSLEDRTYESDGGLLTAAPSEPGFVLAPKSRSLAHSARPLAIAGRSEELRLPTVIVDLANDTEELVSRLAQGDQAAAERLIHIGAAAVPALVGAFPGPITSELRRGVGDGPPRASDCGPLLKVLARIGPKAAGVLSVRSNDGDPIVRAWATRLLGEMPCMDAARAVARRFVDDDADVRRAALAAGRMLEHNANARAVLAATLSEMLLDFSRQDRMQHMVIEAIADLREARALPALATLLAAGSPEIQRSTHWALVVIARTDFGEDAAAWDAWWRANSMRHRIEWLIDALMHDSQEIRRAAGDELKSLTKEYFGYYDDLPPKERERAQKRYRDWWESKGKARFT